MDENLKSEPLVSIMMTSYNRADYIGAAIDSVLQQTYPHWELLILDDASTDNTEMLVSKYAERDLRIKYLPASQNLGITKNRNRGFEFASGKYVAVLDSDDLWTDKQKLQKQVTFLESHPEYALVGTGVDIIDGDGEKTGSFHYVTADSDIRKRLLVRNQFTHSAILMRSSMLPSRRPYDESGAVSIWEDYDLILRLGLTGKLANLPEQMIAYRKHQNNVSKAHRLSGALAHLAIIKKNKNNYPDYPAGLLKGYLRLALVWI